MEKEKIENYVHGAIIDVNQWLDELCSKNEKEYEDTILELWNQYCLDNGRDEEMWFDLRKKEDVISVVDLLIKDPSQRNTPIGYLNKFRYAYVDQTTNSVVLADRCALRDIICEYMADIFESVLMFPYEHPYKRIYQILAWPILKGENMITSYAL